MVMASREKIISVTMVKSGEAAGLFMTGNIAH